MNLINFVQPKKAILTNLHTDLDYFDLKKRLPKNIIPAFDGLNFFVEYHYNHSDMQFFP